MKYKVTSILNRSDLGIIISYWIFATFVTLPSYINDFGLPRAILGMVFNIFYDTATVLLIVFVVLPNVINRKHLRLMGLLFPLWIVVDSAIYNGGYSTIFDIETKWGFKSLVSAAIGHAKSFGLFGVIMIGKHYYDIQKRLLVSEKEKAESELKLLRAQIDPHFLFNNLNILSILINQDKEIANSYLKRFSSLYRYLIRHKDDDFVMLEEELEFVGDYVYLLEQRFGHAYCFKIEYKEDVVVNNCFIVPGTLQILVENTVKHNSGDEQNPLDVTIKIFRQNLVVSNELRPKKKANVESTGTGLLNLDTRYRMLCNKPINIAAFKGIYEVTIPLIKQTNLSSRVSI